MYANSFPTKSERIASLREAIIRRAPGISSKQLDFICNSINIDRRYFIKSTTSRDKFLNLVTREKIITEDRKMICEVLPLYGSFQSPYFEKIGSHRRIEYGKLDPSFSAAAIKICAGKDALRSSVSYSLILYMAKYDNF